MSSARKAKSALIATFTRLKGEAAETEALQRATLFSGFVGILTMYLRTKENEHAALVATLELCLHTHIGSDERRDTLVEIQSMLRAACEQAAPPKPTDTLP